MRQTALRAHGDSLMCRTSILASLVTRLPAIVAVAILAAASATAQQPPSGANGQTPRIVDDRSGGEVDRIRERAAWFFEPRKIGTSSSEEMADLRRVAVEQTRAAIELQRQQRASMEAGGIGQNFWESKGPSPSTFGGWNFGNIAGRVSTIAGDFAGGVLYVGTASGGLWKSTNDGLSWTSIFDDAGTMTVGAVAVDPSNPDVVWAGTGENSMSCENYFGIGLLRSPDQGQTWELRNGSGAATLDGLSYFASVVIDPRDSDHVVTGGRYRGCETGSPSSGGIFTTSDAGLTWTERLGGVQVYEIAQDPTMLDTYWSSTSTGVYKSTDNGVTWNVQTQLPNGGSIGRNEIAIAPSDGNVVYALFDNGGNSFWRTDNGGVTWTQMTSGESACEGQCWYNMVIRVHRTNPNIVYRGTIRIWKTINGGSSWSVLTDEWGSGQQVHQDTHYLLMHPTEPDTFYVGSDGGIWKTANGGTSFGNLNGNLNVTQFYAIGTDANDPQSIICGGAQDNSSLARSSSNVWDLQWASGDGFVCHINPQQPNYAYVTSYPSNGYPTVVRSTSGLFGPFGWPPITWGNGINQYENASWVTPYVLDPGTPSIMYLGTQRMYRSTNRGSSWTPQDPVMTNGTLITIDVNRNFPTYLYVGASNGRTWRTENSGTDWTNITDGLPAGHSVNDLASDPTNPDRAFAVVSGFNVDHLWEWNEGQGWASRGAGLPNVPANSIVATGADEMFVGTDTGVFRSADGGQNFTPFMDGMPQGTVVTDLKLDLPDLITAGTYGRGAWQIRIEPAEAALRFDSVEQPMFEQDGDGDDKVEPGETWLIRPRLRNLGALTALGVTARLESSTPGISVMEPSVGNFGDLAGGDVASVLGGFYFTITPDFPCGDFAVFDVLDITSTNVPDGHPDAPAAFSIEILDHKISGGGGGAPPSPLDGEGGGDWSVQVVGGTATAPEPQTIEVSEADPFQFDGGGQTWLHRGGTDSRGGAGFLIPATAELAQMRIVHRYDTGAAHGRVAIDAVGDGKDEYQTLVPRGKYPGDREGFAGTSDGWTTSLFDLSAHRGKRVWVALVYENGVAGEDEWTVRQAEAMAFVPGNPICDVTPWPGSVPTTALFGRAGSDLEAFWGDSCNAGEFGGQTYSVHAGDLQTLQSGTFTHVAVGSACDLVSPATFTPGPGDEYYLIVPNAAGREGGYGAGSGGASRPQVDATCGAQREAVCLP